MAVILLLSASASALNITACRNLNVSGTTYVLTANLTDTNTCFTVTADNVTLDCQGHKINYSTSAAGNAVDDTGGYDNITIKNCRIYQGGNFSSSHAVHLKNSKNTIVRNNTIDTNDDELWSGAKIGVYLDTVSDSRIEDNQITTYGRHNLTSNNHGVYLLAVHNSNITDNIINTSGGEAHGILLVVSSYLNRVTNNNITITGFYSQGIETTSSSYRNTIRDNIIYTSDTNSEGISLFASSNSSIINNSVTTQGAESHGISLSDTSNSNNLTNNIATTNGNTAYGIYLDSSSKNNLLSNTVSASGSSSYGICLYDNSDSNTIVTSTVKSTQSYGVYLEHFGSGVPGSNVIYNNLINGSNQPVGFSATINANIWNTTQKTGTRIYSAGTQIGGNFYTNRTNGGYSRTCTDANKDGFCDSWYNVSANAATASTGTNVDYLPYSDEYDPPVEVTACRVLNETGTTYLLTADVNSSGTCFKVTAANVTLDCNGYKINYSQSTAGYGVNDSGGYDDLTIRDCRIYQGGTSSNSYGLKFDNGANNGAVTNNTISTLGDGSEGIYFISSSNNSLSQNALSTSGQYSDGIFLWSSPYNSIFLNNISATNQLARGIFLSSNSNHSNVSLNRINTYGEDGIGVYALSSSYNSIYYNNITTTGETGTGVYLDLSINSTVKSNTISTSNTSSYGICLSSSSKANITSNTMNTSSLAIYLRGGTIESFNHSIDTSNTEQGEPIYYYFDDRAITIEDLDNIGQLLIVFSDNLIVVNMTLDKDGIFFAYTQNTSITDCEIRTTTISSYGIYFYESSYNNITYNNITTAGLESYGVYLHADSEENNIVNSTIISKETYALYLEDFFSIPPQNNIIYNCLLNGSAQPVGFSFIKGANKWNTTQQSGTRIYGNGSLIGGNYYTNSSGTGYSDTCVDSEPDGFCDSWYNVTANAATASTGINVDYLPLSDEYEPPLDCGNLTTANTVYTLTQNVTAEGTCFTIRANNITVDCQGHRINYSQSTLGYGVNDSGGYDYITVRDCVIVQGGTIASSYGIYFKNVNEALIDNNTIATSYSTTTDYKYGIFLQSSGNTTIRNNIIRTYKDYYNYGIYLVSSSDNNITSNNITTSGYHGYGIRLYSNSNRNNLTHNVISTSGNYFSYGIYTRLGSENRLSDNNITTSGSYGYGILIYSCSDSTLSDNMITTLNDDGYGIYLDYSTHSNITGNTINTTNGFALYVEGEPNRSYYDHSIDTSNTEQGEPIYYYFDLNNSVIEDLTDIGELHLGACSNITVRNLSLDEDGMVFGYTHNSSIYDNTISINNSYVHGIWLIYSTQNNLSGNNITTTGNYSSYGIHLLSNSSSNNITNNNITTGGSYYNTGIYAYESANSTISGNVISVSSGLGYGIYLWTSCGNSSITDNRISSGGSTEGHGIYLEDNSGTTILRNNISTSGADAYGIYLLISSGNNITQNTASASGSSSYGIGIVFGSSNNRIYNNLINGSTTPVDVFGPVINTNIWNTTQQNGTRIYSNGNLIGGNYYTNSSGTGFSDTCTDANKDGFCDAAYTLATNNIDYLPLSDEYGVIMFSISLISPGNQTVTNDNTTAISFSVNGSENAYNCSVYFNDTVRGNNASTLNDTATMITTSELADGHYLWHVNCSAGGIMNQSETRNLWVDVTPPSYSLNSTNSTLAGTQVEHRLLWQDNLNLSGFVFSFDNGTGSFTNDSWSLLSGAIDWSNVTKVVNSTAGATLRWIVYANDSAGNWRTSSTYSYITTSVPVYFIVSLNSPLDQTTTNDNTTDVNFDVVGTEATYNCSVYFNNTARGNNASVQNDTATTITTTALIEGPYLWYVNCSGEGVMNQSEVRNLWIDTTPPAYSLNSTNSTLAGTRIRHNLRWSDNLNLSNYLFRFDNGTGSFVNDSWAPLSGAVDWSNVTKIVASSAGSTIRWIVYANDSAGNRRTSATYTYVTTAAPVGFSVSLVSPSNATTTNDNTTDVSFTVAGTEAVYNCSVYFNNAVKGNNVSTQNDTVTTITTSELAEDYYLWYVNCTAVGVTNQSEIRVMQVDATSPSYSLNSINSTLAGTLIEHRLRWQDNLALAGFIFSFDNGTGAFINDSWVPTTGAVNWSNVTKAVNSTVGATIRWIVYANDSAGNRRTSATYNYVTTSAFVNFTIVLHSPANLNLTDDPTPSFNFTVYGTNASYVCRLLINDTGYGLNAATQNNTPTVITANSSLADGSYVWHINCSANGEMGESASRQFEVDTRNPQVTLSQPTAGLYGSNNLTLQTTVVDANPGTCWYSLNSWVTNTTYNCVTTTFIAAEGASTIRVAASDTLGHVNNSVSVAFSVDSRSPSVVINSPLTATYASTNLTLDTTVTDPNRDVCWYSLDSWMTNVSYDCSAAQLNASVGANTVRVGANDTLGRVNSTEYVSFTVDLTASAVTLISPLNASTDLDGDLTLRYLAVDNSSPVLNCTLYSDVSGGWQPEGNQLTANGAIDEFNLTGVADGTYAWNVLCSDGASPTFADQNFSFIVDTSTPDLTISTPDIVLSDPTPTTGATVLISVNAHNLGGVASGNFEVGFLLDGVYQSNNSISVGAYSTNTTIFSWTAVGGAHTIRIALDYTDSVAEASELNNNATAYVTASNPPPPTRESMSISVSGNCVGNPVTMTVRDEGGQPISGVSLRISLDGSLVDSASTNGAGQASFTPTEAGSYDILAEESGYYDEERTFSVSVCASCTDGIKNQDESDVDCGGATCSECSDGKTCSAGGDCASGWCYNGSCRTSTCFDGIFGPGELGIDCGGPCPVCISCTDGLMNQDESDVDCGGVCPKCGSGLNCSTDSDCSSNWCKNGACTTPSCMDGTLNQDESDIDCGGSLCLKCSVGESCAVDQDCTTSWCSNGSCQTPTCFDGARDQNESGIDCGGPCIACHCSNSIQDFGESGVDCGGECPSCACSNGVRDGNESDVDCGGSCSLCGNGRVCSADGDCASAWCFEGLCSSSSCGDGLRGPGEEGIDCGGACMPCHCFNSIQDEGEVGVDCGGGCSECRLIRIVTNETETGEKTVLIYNSSSICLNKLKDAGESDIDCGGHCPPCLLGKSCSSDSDCLSSWCYNNKCRKSTCSDGILGPGEMKVDCGGGCGDCPWIKVVDRYYLGENITIVVMNPRDGLILKIKAPDGKTTEYKIGSVGKSTYWTVTYLPNVSGMYYLILEGYDETNYLLLEGYDEKYITVRRHDIIPILEDIPEEIKSLFMPLMAGATVIYLWRRRRTKVVVDETTLNRFLTEGEALEKLVGERGRLYVPSEEREEYAEVRNVVPVELSDSDKEAAEQLSDQYGVTTDIAKTLLLARKLRAKRIITAAELPDELRENYKGTKIMRPTLKTLNHKIREEK
jgi:parallel beta-helix repeat protein